MKGTELMLGDWVMHDGKPKKVDVIWSANQVSLYDPSKDWGSIYADKFSTDEIEPVQLTNVILNGFDPEPAHLRDGLEWQYITHYISCGEYEDYQTILVDELGNGCYELTAINEYTNLRLDKIIRYVHEFQHSLRLCGIEKEIDL